MAGLTFDGIPSTQIDSTNFSGTTLLTTNATHTAATITTLSGTNAQLAGYAMLPASGGGVAFSATATTAITGGMWVEAVSGTTSILAKAGTAAAYPKAVGVALNTVASGTSNTVQVQYRGVAYMRANGNITIGDYVQKGAGGALDGVVVAGSATVEPAYIVGVALNTAASGTSAFVPVLLQ